MPVGLELADGCAGVTLPCGVVVGLSEGCGAAWVASGEGLAGTAIGVGDKVVVGDAVGAVDGAGVGVGLTKGDCCSPRMLALPVSKTPATQAIISVAKVPINRAFQPSSEISLRREGMRAIVPPTKMPTDAR
jgi:hypothetical protein